MDIPALGFRASESASFPLSPTVASRRNSSGTLVAAFTMSGDASTSPTGRPEFPSPPRAIMRASVFVAGVDDGDLVEDLAAALAERLDWADYGASVIPATSLPLDVPDGYEALVEVGALIIALDENQPAAEFEDGSAEPGTSEVRIRFEQPLSHEAADRAMLLGRRADVRREFSRIHGSIGR